MEDVLHAGMGGIEMSEWIEYTGSDEQLKEILFAANKHGVMIIHHNGELCPSIFTDANELSQHLDKRTKYPIKMFWLCQPHPYADLINIWRLSGCPVWVRPTKPYEFKISDYLNHPTTRLMVDGKGVYLITTTPYWNIPGAEYSLTPFED